MSDQKELIISPATDVHLTELERELRDAHRVLRDVEGELAEEQAAINRFRMHCKLKLGDWVDELQDLQGVKQTLLIRLRLRQQAEDAGIEFDADAWLRDKSGESASDWWETATFLDAEPESEEIQDARTAKKLYRELARKFHPDMAQGALQKAYCTAMMTAVNEAYQRQDWQALRDFAGEIDPRVAETLNRSVQSRKFRKLQQKLRKCKQRQRKVAEQLRILRQDNVAKLWHRAQQVDVGDGQNWWEEEGQALAADIEGYRVEIGDLRWKIDQKW